jgi:hypothetical protein
MPPATAPSENRTANTEPTLWQRYSPHGELPLASTASLLAHAFAILALIALSVWWFAGDGNEENKPPRMDLVEIEGEGGGLGGLSVGPGKNSSGPPGKAEGAQYAKGGGKKTPDKVADTKIKDLPQVDNLKVGESPGGPVVDQSDVFAKLDREAALGAKYLQSADDGSTGDGQRPGFKGGDKNSPPGGAGGKKGPGAGLGVGSGKGPGEGSSKTGSVFSKQRKREWRWKINASDDGWVHLKKLQALKVTLLVPLKSKPGFMLRYDLSGSSVVPKEVRAADDDQKVRWKNDHAVQMVALAKVLGLKEVPPFTVIYLPSDLEDDMARRELAYKGRSEHEIAETIWDLRERDGVYDNEPYIVSQKLKSGVK